MAKEDLYEDAAKSLSEFIRTFANAHYDPVSKSSITDFEHRMLHLAADKLEIDEAVRQREAERVSSPDERLSKATRDWGLIRGEDSPL